MLKKLSALAASIVAFVFLFVSITHACSGLAPMKPAIQQSPMNMGGSDNPPCSKEKGDICQSVRDSILSVKPSISAAYSQQTVPPVQLSVESPTLHVSSAVAPVVGVAFHPVFKLPLTLSYHVLRI